jgi:formyl-CoA transferase
MNKETFFKSARKDCAGPLEGLLVIEAASTWAGPLAAMLLGDHGASVIKIEDALGDVGRRIPPMLPDIDPPLSFLHATVNRNKRSVSLDLHDAADQSRLLQLLDHADVFISGFRPGVLDKWGLGYEPVHERCPKLVYVSISGYGQYGANAQRSGYDPIAQAASGFMQMNGAVDGPPTKAPTFLGDDLTGLHAALSTMTALWHSQKHGEGQHVDVALADSILLHMNGQLTLGAMGVPYPKFGNRFTFAAPVDAYRCRDGDVYAGVLLDAHWKVLARLVGRPELADDPDFLGPGRIVRREEVESIMSEWFTHQTVSEAVDAFVDAGLPISRINNLEEAAQDPQVLERDMLQEVEYADGQRIPVAASPAKLSRTPLTLRKGASSWIGEHTDEVLREFGID